MKGTSDGLRLIPDVKARQDRNSMKLYYSIFANLHMLHLILNYFDNTSLMQIMFHLNQHMVQFYSFEQEIATYHVISLILLCRLIYV